MATTSLDQIISSGGISFPNFFNGRILSAEDLRLVRDADRRHRRLLGRAIGTGVAEGLRVAKTGVGEITVSAGLAINRQGDTIDLPDDVALAVTGVVAAQTQVSSQLFFECGDLPSASPAQNTFLLTVRPDSVLDGSAPADPYLAGDSCGPGFEVDGVRFRRVDFDADFVARTNGITSLAPVSELRRNSLAHVFLGSRRWFDYIDGENALHPAFHHVLDAVGVDDCEVPLAVFRISGGDVRDLDVWSVRRPLTVHWDVGSSDAFMAPARQAVGTATLLQFQSQLDHIDGVVGRLPRALDDFRFLPGAGLLYGRSLAGSDPGSTAVPDFFDSLPADAVTVSTRPLSSSKVENVVRDGGSLAAIELLGSGTVVESRGLPMHFVPVEESLDSPGPYGVFVSAAHPLLDRIRLDDLEDQIAELTPEPSPDPFVSVDFLSKRVRSRKFGVIEVQARFRLRTNTPGTFAISSTLEWQQLVSPDLISNWSISEIGAKSGPIELAEAGRDVTVQAVFQPGIFTPGPFDRTEASVAGLPPAAVAESSRGGTPIEVETAVSETGIGGRTSALDEALRAAAVPPGRAPAVEIDDLASVAFKDDWKLTLSLDSGGAEPLTAFDQHRFSLAGNSGPFILGTDIRNS